MNDAEFAQRFEGLFRETYVRAVRRLSDKRERLTPETIAMLDHLALSGPLTPGELAKHLNRAPSTLSEMLEHLFDAELLERDRDPNDGRKSLIWLSAAGQTALAEARQVLDTAIVARAARALSPAEREQFFNQFQNLVMAMKGRDYES
jgi:DNA-binding MarR family transcriptional regulator